MTKDDMDLWKWFVNGITQSTRHYPFVRRDPTPTVIDLHGLTTHNAYKETLYFVRQAKLNDIKCVRIITGRSGDIRKEFPDWMVSCRVKKIVAVNSGSFDVYL